MKISKITTAILATGLAISSAKGANIINPIEFRQADQAGFDIWPTAYTPGTSTVTTANFATPLTTSGTTTVTITASTALGQALNRGTIADGTPAGFSYSGLYRDLMIATTPTGFLTIDISGLNPSETYQFTLYAWDPGDARDLDRTWQVTGGTGVPATDTVNWSNPLVDNETFALNFDITTDAAGTFQLTDVGALQGSAINGFILSQIPEPSTAILAVMASLGLLARRRR